MAYAPPCLATLMLALCSSLVCPRLHGNCLTDVNLSGCACLVDGAAATHRPHPTHHDGPPEQVHLAPMRRPPRLRALATLARLSLSLARCSSSRPS